MPFLHINVRVFIFEKYLECLFGWDKFPTLFFSKKGHKYRFQSMQIYNTTYIRAIKRA